MKNRMSRSHSSRSSFKIDNMLKDKINKQNEKTVSQFLGDYMTLMFMGFHDKSLGESVKGAVKVETILLKLSHKKRKDSASALMQATVGTSNVEINPIENENQNKIPVVSVPVESFKPLGGPMNRSSILLLRVETQSDNLIVLDSSDPPPAKRMKTSSILYGAELVIFDKQGRCLLTEGDYVLALEEIMQTPKNMSSKKLANWETIPEMAFNDKTSNSFDNFDKCPTLKFRLLWTKEASPLLIEVPLAISTIKMEKEDNISNKENHLDQQSNNNNNKTTINGHNKEILCVNGEDKFKIVYQFIYNSNSRQQTETCADFHCPWCSINCIDLYPLLKHLKLCHSRFNFIWTQIPNGAQIDVSINELYDGSYTGSPHDLIGQSGYAFSRTGPVRRTVVTNLLVCRPKRSKPQLSEFSEIDEPEIQNPRTFITGHNR